MISFSLPGSRCGNGVEGNPSQRKRDCSPREIGKSPYLSSLPSQRCIESQTAYARIMQQTTTKSLSAGGLDIPLGKEKGFGRKEGRLWRESELFPADGMGLEGLWELEEEAEKYPG